jgi:serine/threonine protein kinase
MYTNFFINNNKNDLNDIETRVSKYNNKIRQKMIHRMKKFNSEKDISSKDVSFKDVSEILNSETKSKSFDPKNIKPSILNESSKSENCSSQKIINTTILTTDKSHNSDKSKESEFSNKSPNSDKNTNLNKNPDSHKSEDSKTNIIKKFTDIHFNTYNTHINKILNIKDIYVSKDVKLIQQIAQGAYGVVFKAIDDKNQIIAVKNIPNNEEGLYCLLECSIMNSMIHPYINNAIDIQCDEKSINIIQNMADCDLHSKCRKSQLSNKIVKKWIWMLCQAIYALHKENIIHGDIKSSNVLVFNDIVKLCDFTLSVRHTRGQKYRVPSSTPTHSAPEIKLGKDWDESADIWSLGCTMYEIAYGKLLFPIQNGNRQKDVKHSYLECIYDFIQSNNQENPYKHYKVEFIKAREFDKSDGLLNDLIYKTLQLNPADRLKIGEILNHPYFKGMPGNCTYINIPNKSVVNDSESLRYARHYFGNFNAQPTTLELSLNVYRSIGKIPEFSTDLILLSCLLIGSKLNMIQKFELPLKSKEQLYKCEREICKRLNFRLHNKLEID